MKNEQTKQRSSADIVERLRVWPAGYGEDTLSSAVVGKIMKDAADEIERLRNVAEGATNPAPSEFDLALMKERDHLRAEPQSLPVKLTGEIACILEDCSPPDKQTPESVAALIEGYQPTWDRIRSALTRSQAESVPSVGAIHSAIAMAIVNEVTFSSVRKAARAVLALTRPQ